MTRALHEAEFEFNHIFKKRTHYKIT